jgi:hypothetical protein
MNAGMSAIEAGAAGDASGGNGGAASVVLPDGVITDVPYTCDSPFSDVVFESYFHLEDFEDSVIETPGVAADSNTFSSSFGGA